MQEYSSWFCSLSVLINKAGRGQNAGGGGAVYFSLYTWYCRLKIQAMKRELKLSALFFMLFMTTELFLKVNIILAASSI